MLGYGLAYNFQTTEELILAWHKLFNTIKLYYTHCRIKIYLHYFSTLTLTIHNNQNCILALLYVYREYVCGLTQTLLTS